MEKTLGIIRYNVVCIDAYRAFGRFIDGGLIANNPTMDALTEIHEYNTALRAVGREAEMTPPTVVVSVGTGSVPVKQVGVPF